jgi:hypothetical protein
VYSYLNNNKKIRIITFVVRIMTFVVRKKAQANEKEALEARVKRRIQTKSNDACCPVALLPVALVPCVLISILNRIVTRFVYYY